MQEFATQEGYIFDYAKRVKKSLKRLESFDMTVAKPTCIEDLCMCTTIVGSIFDQRLLECSGYFDMVLVVLCVLPNRAIIYLSGNLTTK